MLTTSNASSSKSLSSGGCPRCGTPSAPGDDARVARFGQRDHLRVFGRDSARLLAEAGFEVEVVCGASMPERILPVVGPADYDANEVFFCRKAG